MTVHQIAESVVAELSAPATAQRHATYLPQLTPAGVICLHLGYPDPATFPAAELTRVAQQVGADEGTAPFQYCPEIGEPGLRRAIAELHKATGRVVSPDTILITQGTTEAIELVLRLLIRDGDAVVMEAPTYLWAIRVLRYAGARAIGVPIDGEGLVLERLEQVLDAGRRLGRPIKFIYAVPDNQNPSGISWSLARRSAVIELAARHGTLIFEDNPYYDLTYAGAALPTLLDLDRYGVVISARSFSKSIGPGIRLGWVTGHPAVVAALSRQKQTGSCTWVSRIVDRFITSGQYEKQLAQTAKSYAAKHAAMTRALETHCPASVEWRAPLGGFYFWLRLPDGVDVNRLFDECLTESVLFLKGHDFFCDETRYNSLRLSLSFESPERISSGVRTVCRMIQLQLGMDGAAAANDLVTT